MQIRLQTRPAALFGAMLVIALIALMPLRAAVAIAGLGYYGLSARSVDGPVWFGRLNQARLGDIDLGDVRARLSPIQLVVGRLRLDVAGPAGGGLRGAIGVTRHSVGLDDMTAAVPIGAVFAPLPITRLDLDDVSVRFEDGACTRAEGRVKALIGGAIGGIALPQGMSGTVRCEGRDLLLPLASQAGSEHIDLRIKGDGRYQADFAIQSSDPAVIAPLTAAGFQSTPLGYTLSVEGRL